MHKDINFLIRLGIVVVLILAFVIIYTANNYARIYPEQTEQAATDPTEAAVPTEPETPTEPTPPETEPPAATEPPTEPTEPQYTQEELNMLALVIYQEAGADYCSDDTRLMVGTVVMNRITDPRFPNTMYEVLTQEKQYGSLHWTGLQWPSRSSHPTEAHAVERAYTIAKRILEGERSFGEDVVFQAEFLQGTEMVAYSDGLYFCR